MHSAATVSAAPHPAVEGQRCVLQVGFALEDAQWLQQRIGSALEVLHCAPTLEAVQAALTPVVQMVAVQFDVRQDLEPPVRVAQWLREHKPELPILGMGYANTPKVPLAALRGGAQDFLDMAGPADELLQPFWALSMRGGSTAPTGSQPAVLGKSIALLGARAGMGTSTLAVHLAAALGQMQGPPASTESGHRMGVGLLDLGFPLRDGLMQLGLPSSFHMVDAIQSMHRLDPALLEAALPRHRSGTAVLAWPAQASLMRDVAPRASAAMVQRLREFFAWQVVDVGGLPAAEIVQAVAQEADYVWAVCDQSVGGIVSLTEMLRALPPGPGGKPLCHGVVLNRQRTDAGLQAADIAQQVGLPLLHVLPSRDVALLQAASQGQLLTEVAAADPYVQVVQAMAQRLCGEVAPAKGASVVQRWRAWVARAEGRT